MGWVQCIHGKTVGMRAAVEDGARPECLDCEELEALRDLEWVIRDRQRSTPDHFNRAQVALRADLSGRLLRLDFIRDRRGPGAIGACTCTVPEDRLRIAKAEGKLGTYTDMDPSCPLHGTLK
jgi:hypothetical protein